MVAFGPQPPLRPKKPGASKVNDETMEWLVAGARVLGFIFPAAAFAQLVAFVWTLDWHWLASCAMFGAVGVGCAVWGFWWQGNVEWRPASLCGATWGELKCDVQLDVNQLEHSDHAHWDSRRDPKKEQTWW